MKHMNRGMQPAGMGGQSQQETIQVPAANIGVWGTHWQTHAEAHKRKLAKCQFDCGVDLYPSGVLETKTIGKYRMQLTLATGFHMAIPPGMYGRLVARSSSRAKLKGGEVSDGTIDAGYIGELFVIVTCATVMFSEVEAAILEAIIAKVALAQIIITPFIHPVFGKLDGVPMTGRGTAGFGSTDQAIKP